jgi:hypothetical protein
MKEGIAAEEVGASTVLGRWPDAAEHQYGQAHKSDLRQPRGTEETDRGRPQRPSGWRSHPLRIGVPE